ncbi:hypothetical protein JXB41_02670 [Candidatus Woesearchaeota archaeon]|nr:hypothetical protein [Candidatus Woesearchaeota archaeon]
MTRPSNIYLLSEFANQANCKVKRYRTEHESVIEYKKDSVSIKITETNSLVEDKYSMNLHSAQYVLEGKTESKTAMIHHHPKGHQYKHLQFKLKAEHKVIRIDLEPLDIDDYKKCIKGFLAISKQIIESEKKEYKLQDDLVSYFFNNNIKKLEGEKNYLLGKIKLAFEKDRFLDDNSHSISEQELTSLKSEKHLLPFLNWEK